MERASDSLPNHLRDIDAMRIATCCDVVVPDKERSSPHGSLQGGSPNGAIVFPHAPASTANHR